MQNGIVFSDLHLFHPGVDENLTIQVIKRSLKNADHCVLNGDIFDFKRTNLTSIEIAIEHASEVLISLLREFNSCHFYYVLGNQDCLPNFVTKLTEIRGEFKNLSVHENFLVLEDLLFLHGDAAHSLTTPEAVQNHRMNAVPTKPDPISRFLAKLIVNLRLNLTAYLYPSISTVITNIEHYIRQLEIDFSCIKRVFFGHTHVAFERYEKNGIFYSNTGTAVKGMKFVVMKFEIL